MSAMARLEALDAEIVEVEAEIEDLTAQHATLYWTAFPRPLFRALVQTTIPALDTTVGQNLEGKQLHLLWAQL